jgi:AcrR family transcriptional regulator
MRSSLIADHPSLGRRLAERAQRAKVLEGMVQAVADKGYANATVADAVRLARVSRGTFYALFDSKEACVAAAYRLGLDVLEDRVRAAVQDAQDWREELRLGIRTYLRTLEEEPVFARVHLLERDAVGAERDAGHRRFAERYRRSFARSGAPVPPPEALYFLAAGVHELACSRIRAGRGVTDLEDTLVSCAVRLAVAAKEDPWT